MSTRQCIVWLHPDIVSYLEMLGPLNDIVNIVLDKYWDEGTQYQCPDRAGAIQKHLNITSDNYFAAVETFGPSSYRSSIRRVLYYFVDMELGDELVTQLDIPATDTPMDRRKQRLLTMICDFASRCHNHENLELCQSLLETAQQLHKTFGGY